MQRLEAIGKTVKDRPIDVVLYLDRLDAYAVDALDQALISGITRVLGADIWQCAVLGFTRASESATPPGLEFHAFAEQRGEQLKAAIAKSGADASDLPVALIENSSQCERNADGEKIVPGDAPWIAELFEKAVEVALNAAPWEYNPRAAAKGATPTASVAGSSLLCWPSK